MLPAPVQNVYRLQSAKLEINPLIQQVENNPQNQFIKRVASNYTGATESTRPFTAYQSQNGSKFNEKIAFKANPDDSAPMSSSNLDNGPIKPRSTLIPRAMSSYPLNTDIRNAVMNTETDKNQSENANPTSFRTFTNVEVINVAEKLQESASKLKQTVNPFDHSYRQILLNESKSSGALHNRPISEYLVRISEGKKYNEANARPITRPLTSIMPLVESPSAQLISRQVARVKLYSANRGHSISHKNLTNAIGELNHDLKTAKFGLPLPGSSLLDIKKPKPKVIRRPKPTNKPRLR